MPITDFDKIHIVGSGNVGLQCGFYLKSMGKKLSWYGRKSKTVSFQQHKVEVLPISNLAATKNDLVVLCVNDDAIKEVSETIGDCDALLVHSSGTVSIDQLVQQRTGSLYFFQSISKAEKIDFPEVPVYVEGKHKEDEEMLLQWANHFFKQVKVLSSEYRLKLHLAGVLVNNFGNQLLALTNEIFQGSALDITDVEPLYLRTLEKAKQLGPDKSQTGPAKRGDLNTLEKHLALLDNYHEDWSEIYKRFSNRIKDNN